MKAATASLREREAAVAAVSSTLQSASDGNGNALFLVGKAGLGKTSLLEAAAEIATPDFAVARCRGERMEAAIPFGVADQLLASLPAGDGGSAFNDLLAVEPSVPYLHFLRRVEAAATRPLLILFDDLHWADPDSLNLAAFLARRIGRMPVALIAALRPWPDQAHEVVRGLERYGASEVELAPLDRDSVGAMLGSEIITESPERSTLIERAWRLSGGNPLLVDLMVRMIRSEEGPPEWILFPGDEGDETTTMALDLEDDHAPAGNRVVDGLLLSRFAGLDESGTRLARCAAVAGVRFRPDVAVAAAGLDRRQAELALEALFRSGLVADDQTAMMRFTHPMFEQALYRQITPPVRRRLHARIFELLIERGLEREAADHAIRGEMIGSETAAAVLERSGMAALKAGGVATAAGKLEWAVRMRADRCPPELLLKTAHALIASGRAEEAARTIERLLGNDAGLRWQARVDALRTLGQANYLAGSPDLGDRHMAAAVEIAEQEDPKAAVRPLLDQATIAWMSAGPLAALPRAARARELAGDSELKLAADALWGHLALECGNQAGLAAVEPVGERLAAGDTEDLLSPAELVWPAAAIYGYAHSAKYAERLDESLAALERAREALVEAGAANGIATVTLFIGNQLVRRGRLGEAIAEADRAEEFSELTPLTRPFAALIRAEALAWQGRFTESAAQREAAQKEPQAEGLWAVSLWAGLIRGQCLLWQGHAGASDQFLVLERQAATVGLVEPSSQPWAAFAVEAHLAAERTEDARRVTENLEKLSATMESRWPTAVALLSRGRLAEFEARLNLAESAYSDALDALAGVDHPLLRVRILLALGGLRRRTGRLIDARGPLGEAVQSAEALGADHFAERAASELHLAGGRRRRPATQRDVLTPAERRVAIEVAAGLTNAEVARRLHISVNTVSTHLKRVYWKLGINSRKQLIDLGIGAGGEEPRNYDSR